ncbi:MAG TPA: diacylglycerol kinase family protein [Pyrinomonadaceae bacterium]|jgi:YegS/Rv2252/BmrU family lipid kinase|nr:diacylglycerol kinase family protein [Pyrinomonadaceae bacterium]
MRQRNWKTIFANPYNLENDANEISIEVIINAGSGADDKENVKEQIAEAFAANNLKANILLAKGGEDIIELAKRAAESDAKTIVAGGGDGTISAVAGELIGKNKTLGVLPLGTLNHFSKDLAIPQELAEAVRVIAENHTIEVDAGEVNGRIFINNSSLGLYPSIVRRREQQQKLGRGKWYAAFWSSLSVLRRFPFFGVKLKTETEELTRRTPFVFVGNNEYEMDFLNIGARKSLADGKLSVYILHRTGRIGLLFLALRSVFGILRQAKDFEALSVEEITIEISRRKRGVRVALDGEVLMMDAPLNYRVLPRALRVIVPKIEIEKE